MTAHYIDPRVARPKPARRARDWLPPAEWRKFRDKAIAPSTRVPDLAPIEAVKPRPEAPIVPWHKRTREDF